jgi:hypothetical protein
MAFAAVAGWWLIRSHSVAASRQNRHSTSNVRPAIAVTPGADVRIRCGYNKGQYIDPSGSVWQSDEFFQGGVSIERPRQFISRTNDSALYQTARMGLFSYRIPLRAGTYELRLHFVETDFGPGLPAEGGEQSRLFSVTVNGKPLLTNFDIVSDADGSGIADVRIFKDIRPDENGFLNLKFFNRNNPAPPLLSAVEVLPGSPHELSPIRLTMRDSWFTDTAGIVWSASNYESGGRISRRRQIVAGAADPRLYTWERYGHFSYAIPVDPNSSYTLQLYFAETFIGIEAEGGARKRVFNVFCNGETLLRNFDLFREAGAGRAIVKSFRGLRPDAQGKLVLTFEPITNYASLFALEVLDETNR